MSNDGNIRSEKVSVEHKPQVLAEMETGEEARSILESVVDTLELRLSVVLQSPAPPIDKTNEEDGEELVKLAQCIRNTNRIIFTQARRIESIIERLEL